MTVSDGVSPSLKGEGSSEPARTPSKSAAAGIILRSCQSHFDTFSVILTTILTRKDPPEIFPLSLSLSSDLRLCCCGVGRAGARRIKRSRTCLAPKRTTTPTTPDYTHIVVAPAFSAPRSLTSTDRL